jgi:hypothetical protein
MSNQTAVLNTSNNSVWFQGKRHFYTCFESAQVAQRKFNSSIGFTPVAPKPRHLKDVQIMKGCDDYMNTLADDYEINNRNSLDQFGNARDGECNAPDSDDYSEVDNEPSDYHTLSMNIAQAGLALLDSLEVMQNTSRRNHKEYKDAVKNIESIARQMDALRNS